MKYKAENNKKETTIESNLNEIGKLLNDINIKIPTSNIILLRDFQRNQ